jgi:transketolase
LSPTPTNRDETVRALRSLCTELRVQILEMLTEAGSGHPGGSLSAIDIIATLYGHELRHDPKRPTWADRDRFVLSKGHGVPALYVTLAHHGYFDAKLLPTLRKLGSPLQGHPVTGTVPGVEACTGSLGQGLSVAQGMALAAKLDGKDYRVFCMMGDGEMQEGQVWEALMSAPKLGADNLVAILDNNKGQIDGHVRDVMPIEPIDEKARSFGWATRRADGHDYGAILDALAWARGEAGKPKLIVAETIKGKGVSFMEDKAKWHGQAPSKDELAKAVAEIRGRAA